MACAAACQPSSRKERHRPSSRVSLPIGPRGDVPPDRLSDYEIRRRLWRPLVESVAFRSTACASFDTLANELLSILTTRASVPGSAAGDYDEATGVLADVSTSSMMPYSFASAALM